MRDREPGRESNGAPRLSRPRPPPGSAVGPGSAGVPSESGEVSDAGETSRRASESASDADNASETAYRYAASQRLAFRLLPQSLQWTRSIVSTATSVPSQFPQK